ncbi:hypothetical protein FJZ48_00555 [Candidatus Uhrbacteria bacterium]|nr:hypothetical protein [Candidatus Uhrbacteria bacterium]
MRRLLFRRSRIWLRQTLSLFTILCLFLPVATHATTVTSGDLIKASGPTVYYLGADQKRYVFPTDKTYFSWYNDFSMVKTVSDAVLASYSLGGNVTYRPGVRMVKITTDPKVYAIDANGTLRWVQTEAMATSLYGMDWAKKIDDIPDAFFINYRSGSPIVNAADFSPSTRTEAALSINIDRGLSAIPNAGPSISAPTSTPPSPSTRATTIHVSETNPSLGKTVQAIVSADQSNLVSLIKIYFGGALQKSCASNPCSADILIPSSGTLSSYEIRAETSWVDGYSHVATKTIHPNLQANSGITLRMGRLEVRPNQSYDIIVNVDADFIAKYIDIYVDGSNVKGCNDLQECRYLNTETSAIGSTHEVYGIARNLSGTSRRTATQTISVVPNDHPRITLTPSKSVVARGETLEVSVTVTDDDGMDWTEIWLNHQRVKHCSFGSCTIVAGPWDQAQTVSLSAVARDLLGLSATSTVTTISVQ